MITSAFNKLQYVIFYAYIYIIFKFSVCITEIPVTHWRYWDSSKGELYSVKKSGKTVKWRYWILLKMKYVLKINDFCTSLLFLGNVCSIPGDSIVTIWIQGFLCRYIKRSYVSWKYLPLTDYGYMRRMSSYYNHS